MPGPPGLRDGRGRRGWAQRPIRYEPHSSLDGRPNVMVDGAPAPGTLLTLSHWPATPTPVPLRADLSAEIAMRWRRRPGRWPGAEVASIDHLDQDGLVSLHALVAPEEAAARAAGLVEVARAGDFATFTDRDMARVSFALATLADPDRSPLPAATFAPSYGERTAALATELLGRLPELVDRPGRHRDLWAEEDASCAATEAAIAGGEVTIDEVPGLDLAVVTVPAGRPAALATRFTGRADRALHPAAVHNATSCLRLLVVQGGRPELVLRYESWVRIVSRPVAPRVDLGPLAAALQAEERNGARWEADGVAALVPRLYLGEGDETSLAPARVLAQVSEHLGRAPPAWGPEGAPGGGSGGPAPVG
ncbi:MAG: DUF6687 family protein [Acidimicrobiales bacterium]